MAFVYPWSISPQDATDCNAHSHAEWRFRLFFWWVVSPLLFQWRILIDFDKGIDGSRYAASAFYNAQSIQNLVVLPTSPHVAMAFSPSQGSNIPCGMEIIASYYQSGNLNTSCIEHMLPLDFAFMLPSTQALSKEIIGIANPWIDWLQSFLLLSMFVSIKRIIINVPISYQCRNFCFTITLWRHAHLASCSPGLAFWRVTSPNSVNATHECLVCPSATDNILLCHYWVVAVTLRTVIIGSRKARKLFNSVTCNCTLNYNKITMELDLIELLELGKSHFGSEFLKSMTIRWDSSFTNMSQLLHDHTSQRPE
jgi:hypothetical protein